jgi:hypothetical protein
MAVDYEYIWYLWELFIYLPYRYQIIPLHHLFDNAKLFRKWCGACPAVMRSIYYRDN